jgi:DNA-binding MarR family transcriptional regulator
MAVAPRSSAKIADAGYVRSRKGTREGRRTTWVALSPAGRKVLREHVAVLREIIDSVD